MKTLKTLSGHYILRKVKRIHISKLSGFDKGQKNFAPKYSSYKTSQFVEACGKDDVTSPANEIEELIREAFDYKEEDVKRSDGNGSATIKAPHFEVCICINQDENKPDWCLLTTEVRAITEQAAVKKDNFSNKILRYCDTIVIGGIETHVVRAKIAEIKETPEFKTHFDSTLDENTLTLDSSKERIQFRVTEDEIIIERQGKKGKAPPEPLTDLLTNAYKVFDRLCSLGVVFQICEGIRTMSREDIISALLEKNNQTKPSNVKITK